MDDGITFLRICVLLVFSVNTVAWQTSLASPGLYPDIELDDLSRRCLGCHDGITADDVAYHNILTGPASHLSGHGVGMLYASVVEISPDAFRQPHELDSRTPLVAGRVSCVSCHDMRNDVSDSLVDGGLRPLMAGIDVQCMVWSPLSKGVSNDSLCLGCHIQ